MVGKITTREEKRDVQSVTGGFHRGFPLVSHSLAAAILHTTSKDYSQLLLQDCGRISMGYMFCPVGGRTEYSDSREGANRHHHRDNYYFVGPDEAELARAMALYHNLSTKWHRRGVKQPSERWEVKRHALLGGWKEKRVVAPLCHPQEYNLLPPSHPSSYPRNGTLHYLGCGAQFEGTDTRHAFPWWDEPGF